MFAMAISLAGCGFVRDIARLPLHGPVPVAVHTTAHDLALAMQEDRFYSDYRNTTLIVQGSVASVNKAHNSAIVSFSTGIPTIVLCDLGSGAAPDIKAGAQLTVTAPAATAERQPSAVMLRKCILLTNTIKK